MDDALKTARAGGLRVSFRAMSQFRYAVVLCLLPLLLGCGRTGHVSGIRGIVTYEGPDTDTPISMKPPCLVLVAAPCSN